MSEVKLGTLCPDDAQRDALHIAVAPVVAAERLQPGEHVGILANGKVGRRRDPIGIVDPFLKDPVDADQCFYLCLYPNTVTGLRHEYTHPAFPDKPVVRAEVVAKRTESANPNDELGVAADYLEDCGFTGLAVELLRKKRPTKEESEEWLRTFCNSADCPNYETVMAAISGKLETPNDPDGYDGYYHVRIDEEYFHFGGRDAHSSIPYEFWEHVENVTGEEQRYKPRSFSCSC